jgi:hypothetical protein
MAVPDDSMSWAPTWLQQFLGGTAPGGGVLKYPVQSGGGPAMGYGPIDPSSLGPMNPNPSVQPFKVGDIGNWFRTHWTPESHMGGADSPPQPGPQPQPQPGPQTSAIPSQYPLSTTFPTGLGGQPAAPPAAPPFQQPARPVTPTPATAYPRGTVGAPQPGPIDPSIIARQKAAAAAAAAAAPQVPNLGYYRPTSGNARGQTWMPYAANDPRMFRGPLAAGGMGAGAIPANATAQVPPAAPAGPGGFQVSSPNFADLLRGLQYTGQNFNG